MTRAAIYARVSTEDQDLEGQVGELRAHARSLGLEPGPVYREKVSATGKVERKEYVRLTFEARAPGRPWSHLIVWSLDRFSREERFTAATQAILDLEQAGIRFHSLKEPILDTPADGQPNFGRDAMLALLPVIAAFESRRRSERVRLAMQEIKAGRRVARGKLGPAFKVDRRMIQRAEELRRAGRPWAKVAQGLGVRAETIRSAVYKSKHGQVTFPEAIVPGVPPDRGEG